MKFLISATTAGIILGLQVSLAGVSNRISICPLSDTIPVTKNAYDNFNLCYQDQQSKGNIERGYIGEFKGKKYFYECWSVPGPRGINFSYIILRSDTTEIKDYDFCYQKPPDDPDFYSDMIVCKVKNSDNNFVTDLSLQFNKIPTIIQPLISGLRGNQHFSGFNRSLKYPPWIYFSAGALQMRYFVYNRNINTNESSIIRRDYVFDGSVFKFHRESFVKNKKVHKVILYGE